ncbi:hypothetical protein MF4836_18570 [Pseudomonas sp. MF4836]|nr:hypothetical protein MF4836_18570 [Pseudomonas sp. MF4836]
MPAQSKVTKGLLPHHSVPRLGSACPPAGLDWHLRVPAPPLKSPRLYWPAQPMPRQRPQGLPALLLLWLLTLLLILIHPPLRQAEWRCSSGDWRAAPFDAVEDVAGSDAP